MEFSPEGYGRVIAAAKRAGYAFARLDEGPAADGLTLFLRHDVDMSPRMAVVLGAIEAAAGARASYFFQLDADTYNGLAASTREAIRALRAQGHCVGLHIDQTTHGADEGDIAATLDWFARCVTPIDRAVSFHRPSTEVLGRRFGSFVSGYQPGLFDPSGYASDSRRDPAFWPKVEGWFAERRTPVQLLTHPEWWCGAADADGVWAELEARRASEVANYMARNFPSLFGRLRRDDEARFRV